MKGSILILYYENREFETKFPLDAGMFYNFNYRAHWHPEIEMVMVCDGNIVVGINSESHVLEKGDIAFCNSGDVHYYDSTGRNSIAIFIVFRTELIENDIENISKIRLKYSFIDKKNIVKLNMEAYDYNRIQSCFEVILKEMQQKKKDYCSVAKCRLIELVCLLMRHVPQKTSDIDINLFGGKNLNLVKKAIRYMESNYSQNITLNSLSEYLKISPTYFSKIFKSVTDLNFKTYLNTIRVEKAENLIHSTAESITDVAYECGFNSIRTFNRVFKMLKGSIPSSQRRNYDSD